MLVTEYASSDEEPTNTVSTLDPAPHVALAAGPMTQIALAQSAENRLTYNPQHSDLSRPSQGPVNPFKSAGQNSNSRRNVITGHAEEAAISDATFTAQQRTFQSRGYALEPNASGRIVGDLAAAEAYGGRDVVQMRSQGQARKRQKKGDASVVEGENRYLGPWARPIDETLYEEREAADDQSELASDEEYLDEAIVPDTAAPMDKSATSYQEDVTLAEVSEFHGQDRTDYLGRSIMLHPPEREIDIEKCYVPKKVIHTWRHGNKAITAIRFFPKTAHLLLSASADAQIKIFDVMRDRQLLRTYRGHQKALTDAEFSPDGTQMLSASLDRFMKLWDVETGQCLTRLNTGAIAHVVRFNPNAPYEFLAGMSDKKIVQFDTREAPGSQGSIIQEYGHHLGPINSLTFVDEDRRFISTSDDKSLRAWEINIPVPIKFVADPYMYALTRGCVHPSGKHALFQSGDNQIVVYAAGEKFRQNRKKGFRGHNTAGHAIDVDVSPDGSIVMSGDSGGYVCFWDWKTCRMHNKIQASTTEGGAMTCLRWNPQTTSRVAMGGTEGFIQYWD